MTGERKQLFCDDLNKYVCKVGTQGQKGQKTPRMNLAIPVDVYEYIRMQSRQAGLTYSEFICAVMRQRQANGEKNIMEESELIIRLRAMEYEISYLLKFLNKENR